MAAFRAVILHCTRAASPQETRMLSLLDKLAETLRPEGVVAEVIRVEGDRLTQPRAEFDFSAQPYLGQLLRADLVIISTPMTPAFPTPDTPGPSADRPTQAG